MTNDKKNLEEKVDEKSNNNQIALKMLKRTTRLLLIPGSGVYGYIGARKKLTDPLSSGIFLLGLEYSKFYTYANILGKMSTYLY